MIHNCSYCDHQTKYKANLKTHVKNIHGEKISQEKDKKNPMKNENYKQLKKIEMMMKTNFKFGVEIDVLKKNVESLGESNANEFSKLAREYAQLTDAGLPKDLFTSTTTHPICSAYAMETQDFNGDGMKKKYLFDDTDYEEEDELVVEAGEDLFGDKIVKDDKQLVHV